MTLTLAATETAVTLTVADDGPGLGLPLARRLARSCGGDIHVGEGPGGSFSLELPRASAGAP